MAKQVKSKKASSVRICGDCGLRESINVEPHHFSGEHFKVKTIPNTYSNVVSKVVVPICDVCYIYHCESTSKENKRKIPIFDRIRQLLREIRENERNK